MSWAFLRFQISTSGCCASISANLWRPTELTIHHQVKRCLSVSGGGAVPCWPLTVEFLSEKSEQCFNTGAQREKPSCSPALSRFNHSLWLVVMLQFNNQSRELGCLIQISQSFQRTEGLYKGFKIKHVKSGKAEENISVILMDASLGQCLLCVCTHDAGAQLFVRDVQRVSVSVKPPSCSLLPAFELRHLLALTHTARSLKPASLSICDHTSFKVRCWWFTRVLWVL